MIRAPRYFFQPSSTRLSKVYAPAIRSIDIVFSPDAPLFPFDTSPRLCRAKKNGNRIGEDKGGNICRGTEPSSRRTWIYCIQTRRNRTRVRPERERVTDDGGQHKGVGDGGGARQSASLIILPYYLSSFINTDLVRMLVLRILRERMRQWFIGVSN